MRVGRPVFIRLLAIGCLSSASASCGQTVRIASTFSKPATGTNRIDQNIVRSRIIAVIDQARDILLDLDRYVFGHTTSEGAGARLANNVIGLGSILA